ncbi:hypothetical protein [Phormidium sp. CCY1219]|uniref:hypothetical protein n=1 Tax=Phormidium sp. CCY1219 TaxID=2886104 RepID=UPI002D1F81F9|nr:hypothetical protein [Phormidium sp. CCY1219]MEB3829180.1 hypothetical protein [Phormidium sp. CCY1219]
MGTSRAIGRFAAIGPDWGKIGRTSGGEWHRRRNHRPIAGETFSLPPIGKIGGG